MAPKLRAVRHRCRVHRFGARTCRARGRGHPHWRGRPRWRSRRRPRRDDGPDHRSARPRRRVRARRRGRRTHLHAQRDPRSPRRGRRFARASMSCARSRSPPKQPTRNGSRLSPKRRASSLPCRSPTASIPSSARSASGSPRATPAVSRSCTAATCRTGWRGRIATTGGSTAGSAVRRGAFADIGVHWIDLAEFVTGQRVTRLVAQMLTRLPDPHRAPTGRYGSTPRTRGTVLFATDGGALGSLVLSQVSLGHKNRIALFVDGASASYAFDHEQPDLLRVGREAANGGRVPRARHARPGRCSLLRPARRPPAGVSGRLQRFVSDVYAAVEGAPPDGLPRFADGVRAAQLTETVLASVATNNWVEVPCPQQP